MKDLKDPSSRMSVLALGLGRAKEPGMGLVCTHTHYIMKILIFHHTRIEVTSCQWQNGILLVSCINIDRHVCMDETSATGRVMIGRSWPDSSLGGRVEDVKFDGKFAFIL